MNLRGEAQEHEDLGHPSAGEALPASDVGLAGDLPSIEFLLPGDGPAERLDHGRRPGFPGWLSTFGPALALGNGGFGNGGYHLAGGHAAREGSDIAVFEGTLGTEGNLHDLVAIGGRTV